jgi:hypothetical protein
VNLLARPQGIRRLLSAEVSKGPKYADLFADITLCFIPSILAVSALVRYLLFSLIKTHACIPKSSVKDLREWEDAQVSTGF